MPPDILIAEDNRVSRELLGRMLATLGRSYDMVEDGLQVLPALERGNHKFLFMDLAMPGLDGLSATRRIRSMPGREESPRIIAVTANRQDKMRITCLANGMDDFLSKPILIPDMERVLEGRPSSHAEEARQSLFRRLGELRDIGGVAFLKELIGLFFQETETRLGEIAAEARGNVISLSPLFHQIQGSAVNLGAMELYQICIVGEEAAENGDRPLVQGCYRLALRQIGILSQMIHTFLNP